MKTKKEIAANDRNAPPPPHADNILGNAREIA